MIEPVIATDEPFGHSAYLSKIERAWHQMPLGTSLRRRRTERFDGVSSVFYAPVEYEYPLVANEIPDAGPTSQWVEEAFLSFVRGEFGAGGAVRPVQPTYRPSAMKESVVGLDSLRQCLEACESEFVYGGIVDRIANARGNDIVGAVYDVLCNPALGHRNNATNIDLEELRKQVDPQVERRDRLTLILPSFPFKDQNRFRTYSSASTVDLGEIALLVRLHCLALALFRVHPFGADIVVLSDGLLYANIFGVEDAQARRYREQLRGFRNLLNIQGTVSILDLSELIDRFRLHEAAGPRVNAILDRIEESVSTYSQRSDDVGKAFRVLVRGMKWNLSTRDALKHLTNDNDAWIAVTEMDRSRVPENLMSDWETIEGRAIQAAVGYAGINLMLRYCDLLTRVFPGALRCTVHPKRGQIAIPLSGGLYPWNGVAVIGRAAPFGTDVKTVPFHELAGRPVEIIRLDMTGDPLYFCERDSKNIERAAACIGLTNRQIQEFTLRPFTRSDLGALHKILSSRDDMTWERKAATIDYSTRLLTLRIEHYERFGFGIMALEDVIGTLVGQAGLQVVEDPGMDRVEVVVFLAANTVGAGLGTRLCEYFISECKRCGLNELFATVRPENLGAQKLVSKLGFQIVDHIFYFNKYCGLWRLGL